MAHPLQNLLESMTATDAGNSEAREARKLAEGVGAQGMEQLSAVQQIIESLKKRDWAAMAGAIMGLWKQYFGTPEEKAEAATVHREQQEAGIQTQTHDQLAGLQHDVESSVQPDQPAQVREADEILRGSETLLIGDSIMHGMQTTFARGERPNFIGQDGFASQRTLARLRLAKQALDGQADSISNPDEREQAIKDAKKLKGPKKAYIYTGGNNFRNSDPEAIVGHMIEMATICKSAGIPEVVVCTRFPIDPRRAEAFGERYPEIKLKSAALRETLMRAVESGRFPAGVRLVDLYGQFADEQTGMLRAEYVDNASRDHLHPRKAYRAALSHIKSATA